MDKSNFIQRLSLMCCGIFAALFAAELVLRTLHGRIFSTQAAIVTVNFRPYTTSYTEWEQTLGWLPRPGAFRRWNRQITILPDRTRSNGRPSLPGVKILAVGDSFTFGDGVSDNETWPAVLETLSHTAIVNGGVSGYGFDQSVLYAQRLAESLHPDALIVGIIADDLMRCGLSVHFSAKPYFVPSGGGGLLLRNTPVPPSDEQIEQQLGLKTHPWKKFFGYSFLADFVLKRLFPLEWIGERRIVAPTQEKEVACLLLGKLAALGARFKIPVGIVAEYQEDLSGKGDIDALFACAKAYPELQTLDLFEPLAALKRDDSRAFAELFAGHMTAAGNAWVARRIEPLLTVPSFAAHVKPQDKS